MTQKEYNHKLLKEYIRDHPDADNKELYEHCNATTDNQKGYIRKKKSRLLTQKDSRKSPKSPKKSEVGEVEAELQELVERIVYDNINEDTIEESLLRLANTGKIDSGLVRCMIDFFIKIKSKSDTIKEDINMEQLLQDGLLIKNSD